MSETPAASTRNARSVQNATASRSPSLFGRESELATLAELLAAGWAGSSAALVLRGEAGIGKTVLLNHAAQLADGARVARAVGIESEMELAFAALHQLCSPLLDGLEALPAPQREALGTAFGLSSGPPPARFIVGLAVLSLLSHAAEAQPLICLVDDAQWLDHSSAQILSFVARRLQAESVLVLFAERDREEPGDLAGLPELRLHALSDSDARELLAATHAGALDQSVRDRIIAETHGNPLALLELPRLFVSGDLAGGFAVPGGLRTQLEASFRRQVAELAQETQQLLLVAAAEPTGDPTLLARAAEELAIEIVAAAAAETEGLIELGKLVSFRHPLLRSAIYGAAPPEARRAAHAALAAASDPVADYDRRAWHRSQATSLPDEQVASELEQSAARARARGGLAAAAAFLERSAALTPDAARRAGRALSAAEFKHEAGSFDAAEQLVLNAESGPLGELERARAERLRGRIAFASSRGEEASLLILSAAKRLQALDAGLARTAYVEALEAAIFLGRRDVVVEVARALPAGWPSQPPRAAELLMTGYAEVLIDGYPAGMDLISLGITAYKAEPLSGEEELRGLWFAANAASSNWDEESADILAARHVQLARDAGALLALIPALESGGHESAEAGDFAAARAFAHEAEALAAAIGIPPVGGLAISVVAWCDPEESAIERINAFIQDARERGWEAGFTQGNYSAAILYNGLGHYRAALEAALSAREHHYAGGWGSLLSELVEAAARSDEPDLAEAVRAELAKRTRTGTDWARGIQARADALVTVGETAETRHRESIERLGRTRKRADLARSHLVYGEWLRRENRRADAREHLRSAHELFSSMGAGAFTERARRELRATGERARKRVDETRGDLTPQETQIARLAADGFTNPEIGAQLYLSPRTIEYHLRKVYPKLGISSRRQLRTVTGSL